MFLNTIKIYKYHVLFSLLLVVILVWTPIVSQGFNDGLRVSFLDVGQGDAIFLDFSDGRQILIDGGPDNKILQKLGKSMAFNDRYIDVIILTHPHKDHVFGLIEVLKRYEVGKVVFPKVDFESVFYKEFLDVIKSKNISIDYAKEGDVLRIGDYAQIEFLSGPSTNKSAFVSEAESFGEKGQNLNDSSLVSRLVFGKTTILFMADAGTDVEEKIINKYNIKSNVLKVGHHGSKYSSSEELLEEVAPTFAIIQVGQKNRYGHPAQQTLSNLEKYSSQILRNDLMGDIIFESDGNLIFRKKSGIFTTN